MIDQQSEREPRRDPGEPLPEQAPGARPPRPIDDGPNPPVVKTADEVPGASENFAPRDTTDVAQHAPGPHGQGDEPSSAPAGLHDYDDNPAPKVRPAPTR